MKLLILSLSFLSLNTQAITLYCLENNHNPQVFYNVKKENQRYIQKTQESTIYLVIPPTKVCQEAR